MGSDMKAVRLAVLRALSTRTTGEGYSPVEVDGCSFEDVQTVLRDFKRRGLIVGEEVEGLGMRPEVEVSGLTEEGRLHLRALTAEMTGEGR
jgi:hypothetical protein